MLKKGFLASNLIYLSIAHTDNILDEYLYNLEKIFQIISECENGKNIDKLLEYPVAQTEFKKLN